MLANSYTHLKGQCRGSLVVTGLRVFAAVLFVSLFAALSVSVKAASCYSDTWMDDSGVPEGTIYEEGDARNGPFIIGCGVTEASYDDDWELQSISVETTIRSPNGRSFTMRDHTWGCRAPGCTYFARTEPSLLWDFNDLGDYTVQTHHYSTCPATNFGYTYYGLTIGASKNVMAQISPGSNGYRAIVPCNVRCPVAGYISRQTSFPYANLYVPFAGNRCFIGSVVAFSDFPSQCQDYYVFF